MTRPTDAARPVWIAVDADGYRVHGPDTYAGIEAALDAEIDAHHANHSHDVLPFPRRSLVRRDREIRRVRPGSPLWVEVTS